MSFLLELAMGAFVDFFWGVLFGFLSSTDFKLDDALVGSVLLNSFTSTLLKGESCYELSA